MRATCLVIQASTQLADDILSLQQIGIGNLNTTQVGFWLLEGVVSVAHEAERAIIEHEDQLTWTCGENRLSLIRASVAGGNHCRHRGKLRLFRSDLLSPTSALSAARLFRVEDSSSQQPIRGHVSRLRDGSRACC